MADEKPTPFPTISALYGIKPPQQQTYTVENRVYKNQQVTLDGYTFRNCAFINCSLVTSVGNFRIETCHIQSGRVFFEGNALRVVKLAALITQTAGGLAPLVLPDGSITIV